MTSITSGPTALPVFTGGVEGAAQAAAGFGAAPARLVGQIEQTTARMLALAASSQAEKGGGARDPGAPALRAVDTAQIHQAAGDAERKLSTDAAMMQLLMMLQETLGDSNMQRLMDRSQQFQKLMQARKANGERLSSELQAAQERVAQLTDEATRAGEAARDAMAAAEEARREAERLQRELDGAAPGSPDYNDLQARATAAAARAEQLRALAQQASGRLDAATAALGQAMGDAERLAEEMGKHAPPGLPAGNKEAQNQENISATAKLQGLIALLNQIMAVNNELKLQSEAAFAQKMLKAREAENLRRSQEYQAELQKARDMEKKMGCIGKIIGWAITVVSVVAAPFTGGASLALAAVGLALAITEEVTGFSLMGKVLEPVMKLVEKVAALITKVIMDVLVKTGAMSKEAAEKVANIVSAVMTAVLMVALMIAAAVVAKSSAVSQLMNKIIAKVSQVASAAIPEIIKNAAKSGAKFVAQSATKLSGAMSRSLSSAQASTMLVLEQAMARVKAALDHVRRVAKSAGGAVSRAAERVEKALEQAMERIKGVIAHLKKATEGVSRAASRAKEALKDAFPASIREHKRINDAIKSMKKMVEAANQRLQEAIDALKQAVMMAIEAVRSTMGSVRASISEMNAARRAMYIQNTAVVAGVANQGVQGVGRIVVAGIEIKAAKILAELEMGLWTSKLLRELMDRAFEQFVAGNRVVQELFEKISDINADSAATGRFVLRNIRTA